MQNIIFITLFFALGLLFPKAHANLSYITGSSHKICQLTGDLDRERNTPILVPSFEKAKLWGTDLGASFVHKDKLYFLFGDVWYSNLANRPIDSDATAFTYLSQLQNPEDCFALNWFKNTDGAFRPLVVPGVSSKGFEVPSGGFSLGQNIYIFVTTDHSEEKAMGRSVMAVSHDDGINFKKIDTFSKDKFINVSPLLDQSGKYLYLWGSGDYRKSHSYFAYMPVDKEAGTINKLSSLRYFAGFDQQTNTAKWTAKEKEAVPTFDAGCIGEFSVTWISEINKWAMLYNCDKPKRGIQLRTSHNPYGPWSEPQLIFDPWIDLGYCHFMHASNDWVREVRGVPHCDLSSDPGREKEWGGEYGPYIVSPLTKKINSDTLRIYYLLSTWNPYAVVLMSADLKINPGL